ALPQGVLGPLPLGDVGDRADVPGDRAGLVPDGHGPAGQPGDGTPGGAEPVLAGELPPRPRRLVPPAEDAVPVLRVEGVRPPETPGRLGRHPGYLAPAVVHEQAVAVRVRLEDPDRGATRQRLEPVLAVPQGLFGPPP